MKIRGSRDTRDWAGQEKHNLSGKKLPSAPGWNNKRMTGKQLVVWAEWAGVSFHLKDDVLHATWKGEKPHRILCVLQPYKERIEKHVRRHQATP